MREIALTMRIIGENVEAIKQLMTEGKSNEEILATLSDAVDHPIIQKRLNNLRAE